jgi:hypothetical protein
MCRLNGMYQEQILHSNRRYLIPWNCTPVNSKDSKLYVMRTSPQGKKIGTNKNGCLIGGGVREWKGIETKKTK